MQNKKWVNILLWICFFPVMLICDIYNKKEVCREHKSLYIAIVITCTYGVFTSGYNFISRPAEKITMAEEVEETYEEVEAVYKEVEETYEEVEDNNKVESTEVPRENWVLDQFSSEDNSHSEFNGLIQRNMGDRESFVHIDTSYIDLTDEEILNEANAILSDAGYEARAVENDLILLVQFAGVKDDGEVFENIAIGIVSYETNTVELVGIE